MSSSNISVYEYKLSKKLNDMSNNSHHDESNVELNAELGVELGVNSGAESRAKSSDKSPESNDKSPESNDESPESSDESEAKSGAKLKYSDNELVLITLKKICEKKYRRYLYYIDINKDDNREYLVIMNYSEGTKNNEGRNVFNFNFARYRANKLLVIDIIDIYDTSRKKEFIINAITGREYKINHICWCDKFDYDDITQVRGRGIYYFRTCESAFYNARQIENGKYIRCDDDGRKLSEGYYKNGKKDGQWIYLWLGKILMEVFYVNGKEKSSKKSREKSSAESSAESSVESSAKSRVKSKYKVQYLDSNIHLKTLERYCEKYKGKSYIYKTCFDKNDKDVHKRDWLVIMKYRYNSFTTERRRVVNPKYAKYRANKLFVVDIINIYDLSRKNFIINTFKNVEQLYEINKVVKSNEFNKNINHVSSYGIHYFKKCRTCILFRKKNYKW